MILNFYVPKSLSSTEYPCGAGYFSSHVGGGGGGGGGFDPSVLVVKLTDRINIIFRSYTPRNSILIRSGKYF